MGMGFAANFADVIGWNDIRKVVPKEAAAFQRQLKAAGINRDVFCHAMSLDDWGVADLQLDDAVLDRTIRQITTAWGKLSTPSPRKRPWDRWDWNWCPATMPPTMGIATTMCKTAISMWKASIS